MIQDYQGFKVAYFDSIDSICFDEKNIDVVRVEIPTNDVDSISLQREGFTFVDRTLGAKISLNKLSEKIFSTSRVQVAHIKNLDNEDRTEILNIAVASFLKDRRFNLHLNSSNDDLEKLLMNQISDVTDCFLSYFKSEISGFLHLKKIDENCYFIELAAVLSKYRLSGAAMSLYSTAIKHAMDIGAKSVCGRISTKNSPALNIYGSFGATFSEPHDVFIKEINHG